VDEIVTKLRVTMTGDDGREAVDFVRPDFLDAYVADARTRWAHVRVSDEPDAGPGGYHGGTWVPGHLDHPLAGTMFPATGREG
jgi:hypothetical protein